MMNPQADAGHGVRHTIFLVLTFAVLMLTVGRWLIHKILPLFRPAPPGPEEFSASSFPSPLLPPPSPNMPAFTPFSALSLPAPQSANPVTCENARPRASTRSSPMFSPRYFLPASACTQFHQEFRPGDYRHRHRRRLPRKVLGAGWGAHLGGMDVRSSIGIGFAMNARGAMEMILGHPRPASRTHSRTMFVALVIMALVTSLVSAPAIKLLIRRRRERSL